MTQWRSRLEKTLRIRVSEFASRRIEAAAIQNGTGRLIDRAESERGEATPCEQPCAAGVPGIGQQHDALAIVQAPQRLRPADLRLSIHGIIPDSIG